jgi:two-component system sensor histidine kinase KdpD
MRTALLAAVNHDLRTPLASVKASVSGLPDRRRLDRIQAALLATIEQNADRLDGLIGNLLDMSRLHAGSLQPFLRPITIDEVAPVALRARRFGERAARGARRDAAAAGRPGPLERVWRPCSPTRFTLATGAPPALQAHRAGDSVVLEVIDHGPGVPDGLKTEIFEPFRRFDDRKVGVKLGLAVAKVTGDGRHRRSGHSGRRAHGQVTLPVASRKAESMQGAES